MSHTPMSRRRKGGWRHDPRHARNPRRSRSQFGSAARGPRPGWTRARSGSRRPLFDPVGQATWLATEIDTDDILFGLADLGFGSPELGSFSLEEMQSVRLPFGLGIERDIFFEGRYPLSVYAEAARRAGSLVLAERILCKAASALRGGR